MTNEIIITVGILMLTSLVGSIFTVGVLRKWSEKKLPLLTSFAAGVFLVTAVFLIKEVLGLVNPVLAVGTIVGGFIVFYFIQSVLPESHHHHADEHCQGHSRASAIKITLGDAMHNIGDGIILVPAFLIDTKLGIFTAASIFVHELVQEISEYFVLRKSGFSAKKALLVNFLTSLTIIIGVFIGIAVVDSVTVQAILLGVSAGAFLQIVFSDLIPDSHKVKKGHVLKHVGFFIAGALVILLLSNLTSREEERDVNGVVSIANTLDIR